MTNQPDDVAAFSISLAHNRLVYSTYSAVDRSEGDMRGHLVTAMNATQLTRVSPDLVVRYFVMDLISGRAFPIAMKPALFTRNAARPIALSPDATRAVLEIPVSTYPSAWFGYRFLHEERAAIPEILRTSGDNQGHHYIFGPDEWINQAFLADLKRGSVKPLLNAPQIVLGLSPTENHPKWSPDGSRVLLPSTLLPLDAVSLEERQRRSHTSYAAEVEVVTELTTPIMDLTPFRQTVAGDRPAVDASAFAIDWASNDSIVVRMQSPAAGASERVYARIEGAWREQRDLRGQPNEKHNAPIEVRLQQDASTPVQLVASDPQTARLRAFTALNPQLRDKQLGSVRTFSWQDRQGRTLAGGLFLPPDFKDGTPYPLAIQLGFFDPQKFEVDAGGVLTTAMAARATASHGILVFEPARELFTDVILKSPIEKDAVVAALEDVIDALDRTGLIDRKKVALVGFSRTGMYVHTFITFSAYPIVAATVADSVAMTPYCYAILMGLPYPSMLEFEREDQIGAPFWGSGLRNWQDRSYLFHLDRIRTPIRYESHGEAPSCNWDSFAILKRMNRPVEMISFPRASHNLQRPFERLSSQQGNVDWLTFWLKGYEDPDPQKGDQYVRWRALRKQQLASVEGAPQ
ncbi:MAG: alpha/beta hydrolase family protein [Steroidobacter sp.]